MVGVRAGVGIKGDVGGVTIHAMVLVAFAFLELGLCVCWHCLRVVKGGDIFHFSFFVDSMALACMHSIWTFLLQKKADKRLQDIGSLFFFKRRQDQTEK